MKTSTLKTLTVTNTTETYNEILGLKILTEVFLLNDRISLINSNGQFDNDIVVGDKIAYDKESKTMYKVRDNYTHLVDFIEKSFEAISKLNISSDVKLIKNKITFVNSNGELETVKRGDTVIYNKDDNTISKRVL
jgi:hypothetical protein